MPYYSHDNDPKKGAIVYVEYTCLHTLAHMYTELKHVQLKQHMALQVWPIKNTQFITFMAL